MTVTHFILANVVALVPTAYMLVGLIVWIGATDKRQRPIAWTLAVIIAVPNTIVAMCLPVLLQGW